MKTNSFMVSLLACAYALSGDGETFKEKYERLTASPKELTIYVVDEEGKPLAGARGDSISFNPKNGRHAGDEWVADQNGVFVCKDPPYFFTTDMRITLSSGDAAAGWRSYDAAVTQQDYLHFIEPKLTLRLTLPYVRKPIPLKAKQEGFSHRRVNGPKDTAPADPRLPDLAITEVGYDAELLELMPPLGQGRHLDFTIKITSAFRGFEDAVHERRAVADAERGWHTLSEGKVNHGNWTHSVAYRFPNKGDGAILSPQFWPYCKLSMPHKAPETGYAQEVTLTEVYRCVALQPDLANYRTIMKNNGIFLRVRTQLDKDGNVVSAHYAKLVSPQGAGNGFKFFYNPTPNDRNLEYDLKTNLRWQELNPSKAEPPLWDDVYRLHSN
jgi:hypothetical protein